MYISFQSCKALFETPCITSGSHNEPQLSLVKLGVSCYIMTVQKLRRIFGPKKDEVMGGWGKLHN
jgi:hypothetical protein